MRRYESPRARRERREAWFWSAVTVLGLTQIILATIGVLPNKWMLATSIAYLFLVSNWSIIKTNVGNADTLEAKYQQEKLASEDTA